MLVNQEKKENVFVNTIYHGSLNIFIPCLVTCPDTLQSLQKIEFESTNDINSKVFQGDITEINVYGIADFVNEF